MLTTSYFLQEKMLHYSINIVRLNNDIYLLINKSTCIKHYIIRFIYIKKIILLIHKYGKAEEVISRDLLR